MQVHRSAHRRYFTTLTNDALRDSRVSFCARGILAHLISLPDGQRADIRTLTERTPEGRERVASALRELEAFGYLTRVTKRGPEGRLYTEVKVFEAPGHISPQPDPQREPEPQPQPQPEPEPQLKPDPEPPGAGAPGSAADGDHPMNEQDKEPNHPAPTDDGAAAGRADAPDDETRASAELLNRVARSEPKLGLGSGEALRLAPLVTEWRRRGASDLHIISSLTAGLPQGVYHPARFVETRLRLKMPAERPVALRFTQPECATCRAPIAVAGVCRSCREGATSEIRCSSARAVGVRSRGAALVRAALRGDSLDDAVAAPAFS